MNRTETIYWNLNDEKSEQQGIEEAAAILRQGGLVAFPTETVYGLGANGLDSKAVQGIYQAKGRPSDNPLILHIANQKDLSQITTGCSPRAEKLIQRFWPGPLTLVFPRGNNVPDEVTGGLDTVAVRMPSHPVAQKLIAAAGVPLAAPSANLSGSPSPTTAQHVWADLQGRIDGVLDGGSCGVGLESTVLDLSSPVPTILRPGGITAEALRDLLGEVNYDPAIEHLDQKIKPRSPGVKYKHYAPQGEVILLEGAREAILTHTQQLIAQYQGQGEKVGVLASSENAPAYDPSVTVLDYGSRDNPAAAAANLYAFLRQFDALAVSVIIAEGIPPIGMGRAVMDRLRRAAGGKSWQVG